MSDERDGSGGAAFPWGLTPRTPEADDAATAAPSMPPSEPAAPEVPDWDTPTIASPVLPRSVFPLPESTASPTASSDLQTQAFPPIGAPVDAALEGRTELLAPLAVGLPAPENEGLEPLGVEDLFGESNFVEYRDEPIIAALVPRASSAVVVADRRPVAQAGSISQTQKTLLWVAGGLVAVLALIAMFLVGMRVAQSAPAAVPSPEPTPTASETTDPTGGPVAAGEHRWDELRGGECLGSFQTAWQDSYTVVDCTQPHPAQLVFRGLLADAAGVAFPGTEELNKRIVALCSAPTVIDYAATAGASDIQISASFAADEADWAAGNRSYSCFVNRTGGADFTASVAVPRTAG